jgi:hypothetical protein
VPAPDVVPVTAVYVALIGVSPIVIFVAIYVCPLNITVYSIYTDRVNHWLLIKKESFDPLVPVTSSGVHSIVVVGLIQSE